MCVCQRGLFKVMRVCVCSTPTDKSSLLVEQLRIIRIPERQNYRKSRGQELGWKQPRVSRIHLRIEREKLVVGHQGFHMNHSRVLSTACQTYSINSAAAAAAALPGSQMTWETGLARRGSRRSGRRRSSNLSVKRDSRSRRPDKCWAQRQNPSFGGKPVHR